MNISFIPESLKSFIELEDAPSSYAGSGGKYVAVKADRTGLEFVTGGGGGATSLGDLTDVDLAAVANGKILKYNSTSGKFVCVDETDPIFSASAAFGIDSTDLTHWDAAYSHISNNGSAHSYINQNVTTTGTPTFAGLTMNGNILLNGKWLSGDGGNEGVFVASNGDVGLMTATPRGAFEVYIPNGQNYAPFVLIDNSSGAVANPHIDMQRWSGVNAEYYGLRFVLVQGDLKIQATDGYANIGSQTFYDRLNIGGINTGEMVVNEGSDNYDFRIEGGTDANLFFTDGSADRVGIGKNLPNDKLDVAGTIRISISGEDDVLYFDCDRAWKFKIVGSPAATLVLMPTIDDKLYEWRSANDTLRMRAWLSDTDSSGGFIFNAPIIVNNNYSNDIDFKIVGGAGTMEYQFWTDASAHNIALVTNSAPNWQSMSGGIFIGNAATAPTGNPASGGFLYADSGALKYRGSSGTVTTLGAA